MIISAKKLDLGSDSIIKLFFYFFVPSLIAMLSMSTNVIVDGFFVAHALGQDAVAALGVTWPVFQALIACELLFSIGGASLISYHLGRKEAHQARKIFSSILYFMLVFGVIASVFLFVWTNEITLFLGANDQIEELAADYLAVIFLGALLVFLHPILDMFAVNDNRPVLAMASMIVASLGNVVFNYLFLFVLDFGIQASAMATILGNALAISVLLWHFLGKKGNLFFIRAFDFRDVLRSAKNGIPSSLSELSMGVVMFLYITTLIREMGERGVVIYTVAMYGGVIFFTILLSIAQGIQPISSFNYGSKQIRRVKEVYYFGLTFSFLVSVMLYCVFYFFGGNFARAFLDSKRILLTDTTLIDEIAFVIRIWFVGYFAMGINMVSSIFLQSIQRPWGALLITLCYTIILTPILLPLLNGWFGEIGIWSAYPLSSVLTIFVVIVVLFYEFKKRIVTH